MKILQVCLLCCFIAVISAIGDTDTRKAVDALIKRVENVELENMKLKKEIKLLRQQNQNGHFRNRRQEGQAKIAFTATVSSHLKSLAHHNVIVFDRTGSNFGNGYDNVTGYFIAPESGVYVFYANIMSEVGNGLTYIETEIVKNGSQLAEMYSGATNSHDSSSNMAVTSLQKGEHVWVRVHGAWSNNFSIHCCFSTFSGFLLARDEWSENIIG
ncbi:complement C1q-like protein 2 [Ruditapes philippinarum]|uniref:complement C1q-like protein 2 n=1 Tax=Ruditapes philippinarum TaxID=129788 RepID=UPI00295C33ED|nr:complement C1q-like protein 2 [Ruditapes philippinarum]